MEHPYQMEHQYINAKNFDQNLVLFELRTKHKEQYKY